MLDVRIDRAMLGDEQMLPLLIWERLRWGRELPAADHLLANRSLAPGPHALLILSRIEASIIEAGAAGVLFNEGHRLADAAEAARMVGAPAYEAALRDLLALLPPQGLPADHAERSGRVGELLDAGLALDELDARFDVIESDEGFPVDCALRYVQEHPQEFFLSEGEAAADVDDFVARLRAAVGRIARAKERELSAAERALGRPLPALVRRLYAEVGAAGWGPAAGFLPLGDVADVWARVRRELRGPAPGDAWPDATVPIVGGNAGGYFCVDTGHLHLRVVELPADGPPAWHDGRPSLPHAETTLRGWLEDWLLGARSRR